jgi:ATP-dependent DNA helicase RecQ
MLSPEQLVAHALKNMQQFRPNFLIVDEAHTIFEWGDSFRPDFKKVLTLVDQFKIKKSLWCSATLTQDLRSHLLSTLGHDSTIVLGKFELPPNLKIERIYCSIQYRMSFLLSIVSKHCDASGIIFCSTRERAEKLSQLLEKLTFKSIVYHAGLSREERLVLEKIINDSETSGEKIIVVATSAFGMGMDYPFLKYCILFDPAFSLMALAQSLGRVARGSLEAHAYVLWHEDDFNRLEWFKSNSDKKAQEVTRVFQWCKTQDCARRHLEIYFNESHADTTRPPSTH